MKLIFNVLKSNPKLGINNEKIDFQYISIKFQEEYKQLLEAINKYISCKSLLNLREVVRETFDLIQLCILILWKSNRQAATLDEENLIKDINIEHKDKLINRGWIIKTNIQVDVKE